MAGDRGVWNFLRTVLHRPGRPAADADQRSSLFADAANKPSEFLRSLQWQQSIQWHICSAYDAVDARQKFESAIRAGLEPEYRESFRLELVAASRIRGHERYQTATLHRRKPHYFSR